MIRCREPATPIPQTLPRNSKNVKMDWQRTLLIAALAVVSYLMILQWQKDYMQPATGQVQTTPHSYPQDGQIPSTPATATASADVPQTPASVETVTPPVATPAPATTLIEVETDVLQVMLDPLGGDIVRVALKAYPVSIDQPNVPIELLRQDGIHTYIAQSGLIGANGPDSAAGGRPLYTSAQSHYVMEGDHLVVDLQYRQDTGALITKSFHFARGRYDVGVVTRIDNQGSNAWQGAFYGQIQRDGSPDPGTQSGAAFGLPTYLGAAYWDTDKPYNKLHFEDMVKSPLNKTINGGWLAMIQHYFLSAWIPDQQASYHYNTRKVPGRDNYIISFTSSAVEVAPGSTHEFNARFYAGPKIQKNLEALLPDKGLELAIDYGPLFFISKLLFWTLEKFHALTGNWGVAIILLTVVVKLIFLYPSAISYRSMAKMRKVQPLLTRLKEQYGDDRQRMSQEMMNLYRKEKINPLGGCLPILIQMPVFLALYWALLESVELRQAPFFGWIRDLAVMDPWFVLPLIMGGTMYVQQMLNPAPPDPMQAKVLKFMPVIFTVMFLFFPAGLVLYWVTNNTLSILQQWLITRAIEAGDKK